MKSFSIKEIKALQQKKNRISAGLFVVEGQKSVVELLASDLEVSALYFTSAFENEEWTAKGQLLDGKTMQRMSAMKQAPGVLAVTKIPSAASFPSTSEKILLLDDISDPGNLGTIIRLADWFDCQLALTSDCCECYNPKVVQASMGSLFRLREYRHSKEEWLEWAQANELAIAIADMGGESTKTAHFPPITVIGNEARGVSEVFRQHADQTIGIERKGKAESLNAATASAIILYELTN